MFRTSEATLIDMPVDLQQVPAAQPLKSQAASVHDPTLAGANRVVTGRTYPNGQPDAPLNPATARMTDSVLPLGQSSPVEHHYSVPGGLPAPGNLGFRWTHGSPIAAKNEDPRVQVMAYNDDTFVLRENICVHWEGPFTYLLFGNQGALLVDTGATRDPKLYPLREAVDSLIRNWSSNRRKKNVPLTIVFTSAEDVAQNAGAEQFRDRPNTRMVPATLPAIQASFKLPTLPGGSSTLDLGGRVIEVLSTPGTHRDGTSFYDPYAQLLLTGDLLYPGKIQIANDRAFIATLERLKDFATRRPVRWILGGHIEMQFLPGKAYPRFYTYKPYERVLEMNPAVIGDALTTARELLGKQGMAVRPDFWLLNRVSPDQKTSLFPKDVPNINAPRPF